MSKVDIRRMFTKAGFGFKSSSVSTWIIKKKQPKMKYEKYENYPTEYINYIKTNRKRSINNDYRL